MLTLILLVYVACVVVAFKYIKIKVQPVSIAVAAVVGVLMMLVVMSAWQLGAPIAEKMTIRRKVVPLLSDQNAKELITKIHVRGDEPVKKGDALWEVESAPNRFAVDSQIAQVAVAERTVQQMEAAVELAAAAIEAAQAGEEYTKATVETAKKAQELNPGAVSELKLKVAEQNLVAAQAGVRQARATMQEAEFALAASRSALTAKQESLALAKIDLERTVVRAPADGFVANMQVTEGTMTTTVQSSAQGTFIDTDETVVSVVLPQNLVANVAVGNAVEVAFKSRPGELYSGKVDAVIEYTGEGQLPPGRVIPVAAQVHSRGMQVVRIRLDDPEVAATLPLGGAGAAAIYTDSFGAFHVISKVTIRVKMWMHYLPI